MEGCCGTVRKHLISCFLNRKTNVGIILFGLLLFTIGVVFILTAKTNAIKKDLKLTPNSWRINTWMDSDLHKLRKVYLYNWTNHKESLKNPQVSPNFTTVGPFIFKERYEVDYLNFDLETSNIVFKEKRTYSFLPQLSENISVLVTNLNFGAVAIAHTFSDESDQKTKLVVDYDLNKENLIITKSAKELLFDGYINREIKNLNVMKSDRKIPIDRIGWFYGKNDSFQGDFEISIDENALTRWKGLKYTKYYNGACSEVKGGLSEIISSFGKTKNKDIYIFEADFCGSLPYEFNGRVSIDGLEGYKYKAKNFDDDPDFKCFCFDKCTPGYLNISTCWNNLPVFMSYSQDGPDEVCDPERENYIVVEKDSGIPIEVHKTYQLNVLLQTYPYQLFSNVSSMYVPMVWYQDTWKIDSCLASHIKSILNSSSKIRLYGIVTIILGISLWVVKGLFFLMQRRKKMENNVDSKHLLQTEEE